MIDMDGINEIQADESLVHISTNADAGTPAVMSGRKIDIDNIEISRENGKLIMAQKQIDDKNDICINCELLPIELTIASGTTIKIN